MPRNSTGKWVARAGATGGGRTYRGQMPVNWYAALVVIVLLGLASVAFARYQYETGPTKNTTAPLKTGSPWYAAAVFDICGTQKVLASDIVDTDKQSFYTSGNGVITIAPKSTSDAGANAVFGKFVSSYKGLTVTSTEIVLPSTATSSSTSTTTSTTSTTSTTTSTTSTTATTSPTTTSTTAKTTAATSTVYRNGGTCGKGTKDAGKKADIEITYWPSAFAAKQKAESYTGDPATLRFTDDQLITVGYVPAGTKLPKPNGTVVTALLDAAAGASASTTTTTPASSTTSTTAPASTTTSTTNSTTTTTSK